MKLFVIAYLIGAAACACTGTDTGNPFSQALALDAHSSDPDAYEVGEPAAGGVVAEVWLVTGDITFTYEGESDIQPGVAPGLGVADHGEDGVTRQTVTLPDGAYSEVVVPFMPAAAPLPEGAPPGLEGATIALVGTTAAGTGFTLISTAAPTVVLTDPSGQDFVLSAAEGPLFVGFDVATWLDGVDIDGASIGGVDVLLDVASHPALLAAFDGNLASGIALYRDADGDGRVEPPDDTLIAVGQ